MTAAWTCLRDGGTCTGISYQVAGMQDMLDAVRATGATNVVMTAGLTWTNDLSQWLTYKPNDQTGNLMVMAWADAHGVGYLAWTWNPWGCSSGNVLITAYDGTPTVSFGEGFRAHLLTQNP